MAIWTARPTCLRDSKASEGPLRTLNLSSPGGAELFFARFDPRPDVRGILHKDFCLNPGRAQNKSPEATRTLWIHPKLLDTLRQVAFKRIVGAFNDAELETILHIPWGGSRDWLLRTSDEFFR